MPWLLCSTRNVHVGRSWGTKSEIYSQVGGWKCKLSERKCFPEDQRYDIYDNYATIYQEVAMGAFNPNKSFWPIICWMSCVCVHNWVTMNVVCNADVVRWQRIINSHLWSSLIIVSRGWWVNQSTIINFHVMY